MLDQQLVRIEIERLDHGYEANVPSINGLRIVGLTENDTLDRLSAAAAAHFQVPSVRLEVFRI
jgi:predicted RNase H-like HicB family nuclease